MAKLIVWRQGVPGELEFTAPASLDSVLNQENIPVSHPCGGRGICKKCAVTLAGCVSEPNQMEERAGVRLSCQAVLLGDAEVWPEEEQALEQIQLAGSEQTKQLNVSASMGGALGAAVDIGTTTLALKLYDLSTGKLLGQSCRENPQRTVAADVMGRIQAALEGKEKQLQAQILNGIGKLLDQACGEAGRDPQEVESMVVAGNTTMLYLLIGKSPKSLAHAPFLADDLFDRMETVLGKTVYLPPCMNAFVGADITGAVLTSGMCDQDEIALLCDIGTNGELALWKDGKLYVSSTAAGPAFEGAGISCGCGSVRGAIDKVWIENDQVCIHTIGDADPVGVCGSGLLDAVAAFLELEEIDETGAMEADELPLGGDIVLLPKDIRAVQLAKAAIGAGIETLLAEAGIRAEDVKKLYLAGGFGSHLSIASAVRIGLIPENLEERVEILGNAALTGAAYLLSNVGLREKARKIAAESVQVNLGGNKVFNEWFIEKMMFE